VGRYFLGTHRDESVAFRLSSVGPGLEWLQSRRRGRLFLWIWTLTLREEPCVFALSVYPLKGELCDLIISCNQQQLTLEKKEAGRATPEV
jgi:hypothetical protein